MPPEFAQRRGEIGRDVGFRCRCERRALAVASSLLLWGVRAQFAKLRLKG